MWKGSDGDFGYLEVSQILRDSSYFHQILSVTWSSEGGIRENMGLVDFVLGEAQPSPNTKLTTHIFPYPTPGRLHVTDLSYPNCLSKNKIAL